MNSIYQIAGTQGTDPLSLILNLMFFLLIFISMFYGQKLQGWKASKEIQTGLDKLKKWNDECKEILITNFKEYSDKKKTQKDLMFQIEDFITFITIAPVSLDPYGIIPKFDHIVDVRDERFKEEVALLAPKADIIQRSQLENLLEATMAIDFIYRLIRHYLILGKKSKSMILLMQISMQLGLIIAMAKAYYHAAKAFSEGSPIGDGLGPLVVASFIRTVSDGEVDAKEIERDTIVQEVNFEERNIYVVRAKGPGGTVGKPGKVIKDLIEQHGDSISRIIMIDAGLKLSGDKTGSLAIGVGAAIGGIGIEKHYIEESTTGKTIPIDALICKQSLEDAITTMKRPITQSVPKIVEKIKMAIRKRTEKGSKIIIAGIGNTIGIGV
ncbi:hypothetical protein LCGC14_0573090 [marine sediment metagenome]|uniref:DUF1512 domain-containing protein n=1 Tax=marine sediment metagenome TaxID=412755 RepID=A0A0F9S292_9ZZZZ